MDFQRPEEARAAYDRAIRLQPGQADAWGNKGWALFQLNRPEESFAAYGQALTLDEQRVPTLIGRATVLVALKRKREALAADAASVRLGLHFQRRRVPLVLASYVEVSKA